MRAGTMPADVISSMNDPRGEARELPVWVIGCRDDARRATAGLPSAADAMSQVQRIGEECQLRPLGRDRFDHLIGKESEFIGTYTVSVSLSKNLGGAVRQWRSKLGRGVPRTAIAPTTGSQKGSTPKPGIASRTRPGANSGPSRTVIPAHRGQHSGDRGQFLMSV